MVGIGKLVGCGDDVCYWVVWCGFVQFDDIGVLDC